jgi:membrane protein required for beta-lactamase induction
MVWLVVSGPLAVVIASMVTLTLALRHPDPPLQRSADADAVPAVTARNHAATGVTGAKP